MQRCDLSQRSFRRPTVAAAPSALPLAGAVQLRLLPRTAAWARGMTSSEVQLRPVFRSSTLGRQQALSPHAVLQIGPEEDQLLRAISYLQRQNVLGSQSDLHLSHINGVSAEMKTSRKMVMALNTCEVLTGDDAPICELSAA